MTSPVPLDRRLSGAAHQLLITLLGGAEPVPAQPRMVVQEQDAVDASLLLLAAIHEQLQAGKIRQESGTRMIALLMLIRDYIRPLPPGITADGTDLLTADLAQMVDVVRATRRPPVPAPATE